METELAKSAARTIKKCCSLASLELIATEMGASLTPGQDIFQALVASGKASAVDQAVFAVLAHLNVSAETLASIENRTGPATGRF